MTKVNHHKFATPREQRLREFVRGKMANAFLAGYFLAAFIVILVLILSKIE